VLAGRSSNGRAPWTSAVQSAAAVASVSGAEKPSSIGPIIRDLPRGPSDPSAGYRRNHNQAVHAYRYGSPLGADTFVTMSPSTVMELGSETYHSTNPHASHTAADSVPACVKGGSAAAACTEAMHRSRSPLRPAGPTVWRTFLISRTVRWLHFGQM